MRESRLDRGRGGGQRHLNYLWFEEKPVNWGNVVLVGFIVLDTFRPDVDEAPASWLAWPFAGTSMQAGNARAAGR